MGKTDIKTDPETGKTCMLLNKTERKQLGNAKSTLELYAAVNHANDMGTIARETCDKLGELLEIEGKPPIDSPDPNAKEDPFKGDK